MTHAPLSLTGESFYKSLHIASLSFLEDSAKISSFHDFGSRNLRSENKTFKEIEKPPIILTLSLRYRQNMKSLKYTKSTLLHSFERTETEAAD